tara:strand:+ start:4592 stop:4798 length:207 start_codon:yes stop_codon:yes gene_type:complete
MEKKLLELKEKLKNLEKDRDRLIEENANILTISSSHKKLNGELQVKLTEAENKIKYFEENYIKIDGKK